MSKKLICRRTSLASREDLSMPLVHEIVLSADLACADCRERLAHMISRITATTESMVVDISEKRVTLTCRSTVEGGRREGVAIKRSSTIKTIRGLKILVSSCTLL